MDKDIRENLTKSINSTLVDRIAPNTGLLETVLALQGDLISTLTDQQLTSYMYTLAQYQVFLHTQVNLKNIRFMESKREFEFALAKETVKSTAKTVKEKEFNALINNEHLQELEKKMRLREAEYVLYDKVPDSISEITNALKKELGLRAPNLKGNRYGNNNF